MTRTKSRLTDEMIVAVVERAISSTTAYRTGKFYICKHDIGTSYHQPITIAAAQSRTKQMELAYKIAEQCRTADEDYPMTKCSIQVDLDEPYKATIIIREY